MSIVRELGQVISALDDTIVNTCSTASQILVSTANNNIQSSNAYIAGGGAGVTGRVIDRLTDVYAYDRYTVAMPGAYLYASRGTTEANRQLILGLKLQHGNSSAGGDMADYTTGSQPADATFFTTAGTTPMASWTTGPFRSASVPCYYDLRGANRYIRTVVSAFKNRATTESSGDESFHVGATLTLLGGAQIPESQNAWLGVGSTSTST
jgi:hypothetical protein